MSDLRKAAEGAFAVLVLFSLRERPSASAVNDLIADLHAALAQPEKFCDTHCTWRDHHPDCAIAQSLALPDSEGGEL